MRFKAWLMLMIAVWLVSCQSPPLQLPVSRSSAPAVIKSAAPIVATTIPTVPTRIPILMSTPSTVALSIPSPRPLLPLLSGENDITWFPMENLNMNDGFTVDSQENLYLGVRHNSLILKLAPDNNQMTFPLINQFFAGSELALDGKTLYLANYSTNRFEKLDESGILQPFKNQPYKLVQDISVGSSPNIYLLSEQGISVFNTQTEQTSVVENSLNSSSGSFSPNHPKGNPHGIQSIAAYQDNLFALQEQNDTDSFLSQHLYKILRIQSGKVPTFLVSLSGNYTDMVAHPTGIYLADYENQRVIKVSYAGKVFSLNWHHQCPVNAGFKQVAFSYHKVAVSPLGHLYLATLADVGENRYLHQKWQINGLAKIPQICQVWEPVIDSVSPLEHPAITKKPLAFTIRGQQLLPELSTTLATAPVIIKLRSQNFLHPFRTQFETHLNQTYTVPEVPVGLPLQVSMRGPGGQVSISCAQYVHADFSPQLLRFAHSQAGPITLFLTQKTDFFDVGCDLQKTTFKGKIFDDTLAPLDGVKVMAKSLNPLVPFTAETTSTGGAYAFSYAPPDTQIEITASKSGYTARRRVETLKSNKQGQPYLNKFDFGIGEYTDPHQTGSTKNALSNKPEIISITPGRNAVGIRPSTAIAVKFSEPMERKTVEDTFTIRSFNSRRLTVDEGTDSPTLNGDGQISTLTNDLVWDKNAFQITWNSDDTMATFAFKPGKQLPSDTDSQRIPTYQIVFNHPIAGNELKDKSGVVRMTAPFNLTDGTYDASAQFSILADNTKPQVTSITVQTDETQSPQGDVLLVRFSKPMQLPSLTRLIAGGMADRTNTPGALAKAPAGYPHVLNVSPQQAARNYLVTITKPNQTIAFNGSWFDLGGSATYDLTDETAQNVWLLPPSNTADLFEPGDTIQVNVAATVMDPSGNTLDSAHLGAAVQVP